VDHRLKVDDAAKAASAQAATGQIDEQVLQHVEPGRRGRSEMHVKARMICNSIITVAASASS
jgi:hypothetical protein